MIWSFDQDRLPARRLLGADAGRTFDNYSGLYPVAGS